VAGTLAHEAAKLARDGCLARSHPGDGSHTGIGVGSLAGGGRLGVRSCSAVGIRNGMRIRSAHTYFPLNENPMLVYIATPNM